MVTKSKKKIKKIPKLRFGAFLDEWEEKELSYVFDKKQEKNTDNKYNYVLTNSAVEGIVSQSDYFDKDIANQSNLTNYSIVDIDDFIYNPRISKYAPVGPLKRNTLSKGIVSPLYVVLKIKKGNSMFFEKYFSTSKWHGYMHKIANYGARHDRMNILQTDFLKMPLPFPSITEQDKIAEVLSIVDQWLQNLKQQKKNLLLYKESMTQKIFSQEFRFKGSNGKDFMKWEEKQLLEILHEHKSRNLENKYQEVFSVAKEKGVINQIEHLGRSYASENLSNYKVIFPGDIVYTKSPTASFPFGIIKQSLLDRPGLVSTLYAVFKPENKYLGFLLHTYFLSSKNTFNYLNPLVHKGAKNTMNIGNTDFLNGSKIWLPVSEVEQQMITEFLLSINKVLEAKEEQILLAEEWRKSLTQDLFI